jgi:hypothetical protein
MRRLVNHLASVPLLFDLHHRVGDKEHQAYREDNSRLLDRRVRRRRLLTPNALRFITSSLLPDDVLPLGGHLRFIATDLNLGRGTKTAEQ